MPVINIYNFGFVIISVYCDTGDFFGCTSILPSLGVNTFILFHVPCKSI